MSIDFSKIPEPEVIEDIDYEVILQELQDYVLELDSTLTAVELESEPISKLLQTWAYRETLLRQHINDSAYAVMLAYSTGTDLDNLAAFYGVVRLVIQAADPDAVPPLPLITETDDELRERTRLALYARTTAGAIGTYKYYALSADPDVLDVGVSSPFPGEVHVAVLSRTGTGIPSADLLYKVELAINAEDIRPLTDNVTVMAATIIGYNIIASLTVYPGPDPVVVRDEAIAALAVFADSSKRLGYDITLAGIIGALYVEGVQNVAIQEPTADIIVAPNESAHLSSSSISIGGTDV